MDSAQVTELSLVLWRIHGVTGVEISAADGSTAVLDVTLGRPVAMGSDLRTVFGRNLLSCTRTSDGFDVVLKAPQPTPESELSPRSAGPLSGGRDTSKTHRGLTFEHRAPPSSAGHGRRATDLVGSVFGGQDPETVMGAFAGTRDLSIVVVDLQLTVRAALGGLHARLTPTGESVVGRTVAELAPPHRYPGVADRVAAGLRGTAGSMDAHSTSTDRSFRVTFTPIQEGTAVKGCLVVVRDIVQQHRDRRLLAELTDVFEVSFQRSPSGQALLSPTGQWLRINPVLERLLDRDADKLLGAAAEVVTHPDDVGPEDGLRSAVMRNGSEGYSIDKRLVRGDGSPVSVHAEVTAIRDDDGTVRGFLAHIVRRGTEPASPADG